MKICYKCNKKYERGLFCSECGGDLIEVLEKNEENELIQEIKDSLGDVSDLKQMTLEQAARILKLIGQQRLKEAHISALVEIFPGFVELEAQVIKAVITDIESAKDSQKEAFDSLKEPLNSVLSILKILGENASSDEAIKEIGKISLEAGKLCIEMGKIVKDMNESNNSFWETVVKVLGGVFLGAIALIFVSDDSDDSA